ncbi:MAG: histidine kinase N-terminal domain-containing protein [Melioribacteraceae bacterium]|nr:histidine kinase N-terminal domain-containing protein [Melioribacteraceae bacterium]
MDYSKIISFIEANITNLARTYSEQLIKPEHMITYQKLEASKIIAREEIVYGNLVNWLKSGASNDEAEKLFEKIGAERFNQGFPLTELNYALFITKKVLWNAVGQKKELFGPLVFDELFKCMTVVNNYFDLGNFYMIRGYVNELFRKLDISDKMSREEIHKILIKGAFDEDDLDKSEIVWRHV